MLRLFWITGGLIALSIGVAGIVLPLVPTTPLLLLAALCFARSSPRLEMWLIEHPRLGSPIRNWRSEGAISARGKSLALIAISATFALSLAMRLPASVLLFQALTLGAVTLFIVTRPLPAVTPRPPDE